MKFIGSHIIIILTLLVVSVIGYGEEPASISMKLEGVLPKIVINKKGQLEVDFLGGRVARLSRNKVKTIPFSYNAEITENTCVKHSKRQMCQMAVEVSQEIIGLTWVKNPDRKKIGKLLSKIEEDGEEEILTVTANFFFWISKFTKFGIIEEFTTPFSQKYKSKITNTKLICKDVDWTKNLLSGPNKFNIEEWSSEVNTLNRETGLNENLIATSYMDIETVVDFKKNEIEFKKVGFAPKVGDGRGAISSFSFGDVLGMSIRSKEEESKMCEISLKADSQSLLGVLTTQFNERVNFEYLNIDNMKKISEIALYGKLESYEGMQVSELYDSNIKNKEEIKALFLLGILKSGGTSQEYYSDGQALRTINVSVEKVK